MEKKNPLLKKFKLFNYCLLPILLLVLASCTEPNNRDYIRLGNREFRGMQFDKAETDYLKSLEKEPTFEAYYNLGDASYIQQKDSSAYASFAKADSIGTNNALKRARNFHNMGNVWYMTGVRNVKSNAPADTAFLMAVKCYENALRCNPNDNETRYNLAMAQYQLKKNQNGGGGNNNQNKDKGDNDKSKDEKEQQEQQQQEQQGQQQEQQENENQMSDQAAEQLLLSAQQDEKDVQQKVKQSNAQRRSLEKDW